MRTFGGLGRAAAVFAVMTGMWCFVPASAATATDRAEPTIDLSVVVPLGAGGYSPPGDRFLFPEGVVGGIDVIAKGNKAGLRDISVEFRSANTTGTCAHVTTTGSEIEHCQFGVLDSGEGEIIFSAIRSDGTSLHVTKKIYVERSLIQASLRVNGHESLGKDVHLKLGAKPEVTLTLTNRSSKTLSGLRVGWFGGPCSFSSMAPGGSASCSLGGKQFDTPWHQLGGQVWGRTSDGTIVSYWIPVTRVGMVWDRYFDLDGEPREDLLALSPDGKLNELPGIQDGTFREPHQVSNESFAGMRQVFRTLDWDRQGFGHLFTVDKNGELNLRTKFFADSPWDLSKRLGVGWGALRFVVSPGDINGDGLTDILGITQSGDLLAYTQTPEGRVNNPRKVGHGWGIYQAVYPVPSLDDDATPDLLAVDRNGALWLYPGNGDSGFRDRRLVGRSGWSNYVGIASVKDLNNDGRYDIVTLDREGQLSWWANRGGQFTERHGIRGGMKGWRLVS